MPKKTIIANVQQNQQKKISQKIFAEIKGQPEKMFAKKEFRQKKIKKKVCQKKFAKKKNLKKKLCLKKYIRWKI